MKHLLLFTSTIIILSVATGCTLTDKSSIPASYKGKAKKIYNLGMKRLKSKDYEDARNIFRKLRKAHPMSMYATLSELRTADCHRKEGNFATAASLYHDFMKDHPYHEAVRSGYTTWQIGYCQYRLGPGDFFIFPPSYEKDLGHTQSAYKIFKIFERRYPSSVYIPKVKRYHKKALKKLVAHELYVADYYQKKSKPKAVKGRLEYILTNYPESPEIFNSGMRLVNIYIESGEKKRAKQLLSSLIKKYPRDKLVSDARKLLGKISMEVK
ncbi:MAG: outer membrane protein assembly factor BamD [Deltaproteobacteria bacterium]|nr:outer membrane protein assembly factor BamD [Deltaproteobacteria bacterium]